MNKEQFMASNHEYFTSGQVDEQIEQLQQAGVLDGSTDEAQLVNLLRRYYRVSLAAEDRAALEHARQRITGKEGDVDTLDDDAPVVTIHPAGPATRQRSTRLMRILSGLAAIILVGMLIGSWLVVTHLVGAPPVLSPVGTRDLYIIHNETAYRLAATR